MTTEPVSSAERLQPTSRSEEDDSDDSGVIKDVMKRNTESSQDASTVDSVMSSDEDGGDKVRSRPAKKSEVTFSLGDLVWARTANSTFYPCVVTQDPHFKFHTKIVKSDPGPHSDSSSSPGGQRQYHVHYLGENKRLWLPSSLIIPYKGLAHYEKMAMEDLQNINKIYKPKAEASKTAWREAVIIAQTMEDISSRERLTKCSLARAMERGGEKSANKKMEMERQQKSHDAEKSHERFKSPTSSPRKSFESEDKKKSSQYRRQDELAYKMSKISESERERKKRKSGEKKPEEVKPILFNVFDSATPTFNRSFKIKQVKPVEEQPVDPEDNLVPTNIKSGDDEGMKSPTNHSNGSSKIDETPEQEVEEEDDKTAGDSDGKEGRNNSDTPASATDSLTEGSLVWAKQRGYPYWPAVVARDPADGEYDKMPHSDSLHSQLKSQRKLHVLFLEYNNQRAWLPSSACLKYQGKNQFSEEAAKAGTNRKKDFQPSKRHQAQYERAVEYSESLVSLAEEERLESVFLKYGWVMVTEQGLSTNIATSQKAKKRKIVTELDTDTEVDKGPSIPPTMHRLNSADRRSSADTAETRLDPGLDTVETESHHSPRPQSAPSSKKKRESSLVAAIALNGDSSSDENSETVTDSERVGTNSSSKIKRKKTEETNSTVKAQSESKVTGATKLGEEEFPRLGDLVWGRMSGFPFWPSFVTRSPQGQYRKPGPNGKQCYHVQFFNWNDESGWVSAVLEFDGLESFKKIAAKKKSDKSYNPAKGAMYSKWEKASRDAEETLGLSRVERLDCFLVPYGSLPSAKMAPKVTPKAARPSKSPASKPTQKKTPVTAGSGGGGGQPRRRPGPASKTGLARSPTRATGGQFPAGWRIRDRPEGVQTFISPDGREFQDKSSALRYASNSTASPPVQYLADSSLPTGWRCQKIQNSIYYFSPTGERFDTRDGIASSLEKEGVSPDIIARLRRGGRKRIGPKSILKKIGFEVLSDESEREESTSEDEDPEHIIRLPNGMKFRRGGAMDDLMDMDKLFDPSNGGMIEMVQLPDIFLGHPTVRVTESDNEMVISDVETGEFIAKKIIYD